MGKRKVLGLVYGYNEGWIAGSYYIENLIACLLLIPADDRPHIKVYVFTKESRQVLLRKDFAKAIDIIQAKDAQTLVDRVVNKISFWLKGKYVIVRGFDQSVDAIFPNPDTFHFHKMPNHIAWIPDFQEKYYPDFFSQKEVQRRDQNHHKIAMCQGQLLVLSSESSLKDYLKYYPNQQSRNHVIPFSVTIPPLEGIDGKVILAKYDLEGEYFICSNQFWAHKGHKTLLKAIKAVLVMGKQIKVVFTGKTHDNRNPDFFTDLLTMAKQLNISKSLSFLGFIPREDQLILMRESLAIIQPSQFEGWSTVVEDAKALNKSIVVSDLAVHQEQLGESYQGFFRTDDVSSLANKILEASEGAIEPPNVDYGELQRNFAHKLIALLDDAT